MGKPVGHAGILIAQVGSDRRGHRPAAGMSADDDVAMDEEVAGIGLRDQVRIHARVAAGDEQGQGRLSVGEPLVEVLMLGKNGALEVMDAVDELLH